MQHWNIYEITTESTPIHGVMLRGRIRKFALENEIELLTENASDTENTVRFALHSEQEPNQVIDFIKTLITDSKVELVLENIKNPVLSKLKVNKEERYSI
jgi:hypothetical protein